MTIGHLVKHILRIPDAVILIVTGTNNSVSNLMDTVGEEVQFEHPSDCLGLQSQSNMRKVSYANKPWAAHLLSPGAKRIIRKGVLDTKPTQKQQLEFYVERSANRDSIVLDDELALKHVLDHHYPG